jgi:oxygen-dependent protoporphyrinogen oxidase
MENIQTEIVIIGTGITGLSTAFFLQKKGFNVKLIDKSNKTGGVIGTISENGFVFETGPNTGVLGNPEIVELFEELAPNVTLATPDNNSKKRLIWKKGKWEALPSGLISAVTTPLFTLGDKFRVLLEPFRKKGTKPFESVADMVRRRLGKSFLDYAVDPFVSGIYAGNPEYLITEFALPKLFNLEHNYGSFIKGSIAKAKEPKTDRDKKATKDVFSAKGGLQNLINALSTKIGNNNIYLNCNETVVNASNEGYIVSITQASGEKIIINTKKVISTIGGHELKNIFPFISEEEISPILNLRYAKVVQAVAGYKIWKGMNIKSFGGLVPTIEKRNVLGILFPSSIFEGRAPENGALISAFMGGINKPELIDKSDEEITKIAIDEIKNMLKVSEEPDLFKIFRYQQAIPQYEKSSLERFKAINDIQNKYKGIILAGNIRNGIGMADRVKQAFDISGELYL